jgi:preprotein translocase subunit SecE
MMFMEKLKQVYNTVDQFFREVKVELLKVTFPTRQETVGSTLVVLVLTFVLGAYLGVGDFVLARLVKWLLQVG